MCCQFPVDEFPDDARWHYDTPEKTSQSSSSDQDEAPVRGVGCHSVCDVATAQSEGDLDKFDPKAFSDQEWADFIEVRVWCQVSPARLQRDFCCSMQDYKREHPDEQLSEEDIKYLRYGQSSSLAHS